MKCPYCKVRSSLDSELIFQTQHGATNQTVTKWDNGWYRCEECGLSGPKNVIEDIAIFLED